MFRLRDDLSGQDDRRGRRPASLPSSSAIEASGALPHARGGSTPETASWGPSRQSAGGINFYQNMTIENRRVPVVGADGGPGSPAEALDDGGRGGTELVGRMILGLPAVLVGVGCGALARSFLVGSFAMLGGFLFTGWLVDVARRSR